MQPNANGQAEVTEQNAGASTIQPEGGQPETDPQPIPNEDADPSQSEPTVEIDGEQVPVSTVREWRQNGMRDADYRKKTMQIAEEKRKLARMGVNKSSTPAEILKALEQDPEAKTAVETLKKIGFLTNDQIDERFEAYELGKADQKALDDLVAANPDLSPFKKAIRDIGKANPTMAWEDIVANYGFKKNTALQRAKSSKSVMGSPSSKTSPKQKSIADMTEAEYDAWKKEKGVGQHRFTKRSNRVTS